MFEYGRLWGGRRNFVINQIDTFLKKNKQTNKKPLQHSLHYGYSRYGFGQGSGAVKPYPSLTLTLSWVWWGGCEKNYLPKAKGREGEEKSARSAPTGA